MHVPKWVDSKGRIHYGDSPPQQVTAKKLDIKINSVKVVTYGKNPLLNNTASSTPSLNNKQVTLYSTTWCGYCKQAVKYFKANNIAFREHDVENTSKGRRDYKKLNGNGVPIILIGKKRMNGFSVAAFQSLYRR